MPQMQSVLRVPALLAGLLAQHGTALKMQSTERSDLTSFVELDAYTQCKAATHGKCENNMLCVYDEAVGKTMSKYGSLDDRCLGEDGGICCPKDDLFKNVDALPITKENATGWTVTGCQGVDNSGICLQFQVGSVAYKYDGFLGAGGYGAVLKFAREGVHPNDEYPEILAVKVVEAWTVDSWTVKKDDVAKAEKVGCEKMQFLSSAQHPASAHISACFGHFSTNKYIHLLMEHVGSKHWADVVTNRDLHAKMISQMWATLDLFDQVEMTHHDLNEYNVMLTDAGDLKVIDFGASDLYEKFYKGYAHCPCTPDMRPPTPPTGKCLDEGRGYAFDTYSVGVMTARLVTGASMNCEQFDWKLDEMHNHRIMSIRKTNIMQPEKKRIITAQNAERIAALHWEMAGHDAIKQKIQGGEPLSLEETQDDWFIMLEERRARAQTAQAALKKGATPEMSAVVFAFDVMMEKNPERRKLPELWVQKEGVEVGAVPDDSEEGTDSAQVESNIEQASDVKSYVKWTRHMRTKPHTKWIFSLQSGAAFDLADRGKVFASFVSLLGGS